MMLIVIIEPESVKDRLRKVRWKVWILVGNFRQLRTSLRAFFHLASADTLRAPSVLEDSRSGGTRPGAKVAKVGLVGYRCRDGPSTQPALAAFENAVTEAKLDDFRFHDLRHTAASWLVQRGRSLKEVQELLGHQTFAMTLRYAHLSPDRLREAVSSLESPAEPSPFSTSSAQSAVESSERPVSPRAPVAQLDRASDF